MPDLISPISRLRAALLCAAVSLYLIGGCASSGNPRDPLEPVNRAVYKFNDGVDNLVLKPAAEFYREVVPQFMRTGVSNFFSNINDVIVALNNLLQGKVPAALNDVGRVLVNTTLGLLGVLDPATELGVEKNNEDFGQTLGFWGLGDGPYLVLPFLGPSSLRDAFGLAGDVYSSPVTYLEPTRHRNALIGLRTVASRADLLEASKILETAALDPYEFVRDAYLQRRRNLVHDGKPPEDSGDNDYDRVKPKPGARAPDIQRSPPEAEAEAEARLATVLLTVTAPAVAAAGPEERRSTTAPEAPKTPRVVRAWLTPGSN